MSLTEGGKMVAKRKAKGISSDLRISPVVMVLLMIIVAVVIVISVTQVYNVPLASIVAQSNAAPSAVQNSSQTLLTINYIKS